MSNVAHEPAVKPETEHVEVYDDEQSVGSAPIPDSTDDSFYGVRDVLTKSPLILPLAILCNLGIVAYGYDNMILSMVLDIYAFDATFGQFVDGSFIIPAYWQSLWNAIAQIATMLGSLSTGYLKDTIGRKYTLAIGGAFSIVGTAIVYTSSSPGQYLGGKFVNAFGLGVAQAAGQTYVTEICPSSFRSIGLGIFGIGLGLGSLLGSVVAGHLMAYQTTDYGYKTCFASQWAWGGAIFLSALVMPETPFFYIKKKKYDYAERQLKLLHGKNNKIVEVLLEQLIKIDEIERIHAHESTSYVECFRGTNWRRTRIILYCNSVNQMIGSTILGNAAYFLVMAGISSTRATTIIEIGSSFGLLSTIMVLVATIYVGKRTLLLSATAFNSLIFLSMGICSCFSSEKALAGVGYSLMLIYITMGPAVSPAMTIAAEVPNMRLRAKSMSVGFGFNYFFSTVMNVVVPYMFNSDEGNLGGKIGWIFFALSLICVVVLYFEVPETKGRSFAEIDQLFDEKVATRKWVGTVVAVPDLDTDIKPSSTVASWVNELETVPIAPPR